MIRSLAAAWVHKALFHLAPSSSHLAARPASLDCRATPTLRSPRQWRTRRAAAAAAAAAAYAGNHSAERTRCCTHPYLPARRRRRPRASSLSPAAAISSTEPICGSAAEAAFGSANEERGILPRLGS